MMAGAMGELSMSESDCVAKMTLAFFFRQRLQPFPQLTGEAFIVERQPAFVDDQHGGPPVEAVLDAVEQIGEHGRRRAGADETLGLEGLDRGFAEMLVLGIEQPAIRSADADRAGAPA